MSQIRAWMRYPRSTGEFQAWFRTDADCPDYLEWLRWPGGFTCPSCGHGAGWRLGDGRYECASCHGQTSVTAGTIFDRTRTPLTVWFTVCWLFATQKDGISALSLQRTLEIGSYQTARAMLGRLRSVLVRPVRDRLSGAVQADETYIGGEEPGLPGGRVRGKKVLTGIAVEVRDPKGIGRCRMQILADGSAQSPAPVHHRGYRARDQGDHRRLGGLRRHRQTRLCPRALQSYLDEFTFRFNRRRSRSRGLVFYRLLELAVAHDPVRYRELAAG